jgi:hypothetical protein
MVIPKLALALVMTSLAAAVGPQRTVDIDSQSAQPIKTISRGRAKISYYEKPQAVAVATTFYAIGSRTNSLWRDFLTVTAYFVVPGPTITAPEFVELQLASSTRTKGGKYVTNHHLTIMTDGKTLVSAEPRDGPTADNHRGGRLELFVVPKLTLRQFTELAKAREVRMRLGSTEFKLKREHLEALKDMLKCISSQDKT